MRARHDFIDAFRSQTANNAARASGKDSEMRSGGILQPTALLALATLAAMLFALTIGRYPIGISDVVDYLGAAIGFTAMPRERYDLLHNLLIEIRLPRVLAAVLIGSSLASSGAAFQAVFRNPLVSPGMLGVLGGASFGAALGMLLSGNWLMVQALAFAMGLLAVAIAIAIANLFGAASMVMLILGGLVTGALFTSFLSIAKYVADPYDQLPAIVYWLMGSLGAVTLEQVKLCAIPMLAGVVVLSLLGRALDALSMGDDEARSLGVPVHFVRYAVIGAATLVSALSVSMAGMIGWIGLIVPHLVRLLVGPGNMRLVASSAIAGALFLLLADCIARTAGSSEIPIGIITELMGIPAFLIILGRARRAWL
jgi:iron complex transport system permease protein